MSWLGDDVNDQCPRERHPSDTAWILSHCFKILMMQTGFAVVESSFVRQKNSANIMMKNIADLCFGSLAFWATGWALAYGVDPESPHNENGFAGVGHWFLVDATDFGSWMFQLSFATTAATIDSGAVAERMNFKPYLLHSTLITGFVYPIVCHWCWDPAGWLTQLGFFDFAGSGPVHLLGGISAVISAWYIGPRHGRFAQTGELEVEVKQGENIGTRSEHHGREGEAKSSEAEEHRHTPYVMVTQLNHGKRVLRTRHAESMVHPRWGALMRFKIHPEEAAEVRQAPTWRQRAQRLLRGEKESSQAEAHTKSGVVEVSLADEDDEKDDHQSVGRWVWEVPEGEIPLSVRNSPAPSPAGASAQLVHGSRAPSSLSADGHTHSAESPPAALAPASAVDGSGQREQGWLPRAKSSSWHLQSFRQSASHGSGVLRLKSTVVFEKVWLGVGEKGIEIRDVDERKVRRLVSFRQVRNVERWQLGMQGITLHLMDLSKVEIKVESMGQRDEWFQAICKAWRPALSPILLRFHVLDHASDHAFGHADLKIVTGDKPDPEKFKIASMLRLSCGGRIEVFLTFTSAERLSREIFQSWDPVKLLFGTFVLWVNWFSFNSGSTYGVMDGGVELASKVAVNSILAASAGAAAAMLLSEIQTGSIMVEHLSLGILGSLVAITAPCAVVQPWEAALIGLVGALASNWGIRLLEKVRIDDPCGASAVHGLAGLWGVMSVGLFARPEPCTGIEMVGLFHGGGWRLLGVQLLGAVSIIAWSAATCLLVFYLLDWLSHRFKWLRWMHIRPSKAEEALGFDQTEHNIHRGDSSVLDTLVEDESVHTLAKKRWNLAKTAVKTAISLKKIGLAGSAARRPTSEAPERNGTLSEKLDESMQVPLVPTTSQGEVPAVAAAAQEPKGTTSQVSSVC